MKTREAKIVTGSLGFVGVVVLLAGVVLLGGCAPASKPLKGSHNRQQFTVFYPDESRTREAITANCPSGVRAAACVQMDWLGNSYLYAELPTSLDDTHQLCTLGHEFMHMVLGTIHEKGEKNSCDGTYFK